jgi:hypothetical protein
MNILGDNYSTGSTSSLITGGNTSTYDTDESYEESSALSPSSSNTLTALSEDKMVESRNFNRFLSFTDDTTNNMNLRQFVTNLMIETDNGVGSDEIVAPLEASAGKGHGSGVGDCSTGSIAPPSFMGSALFDGQNVESENLSNATSSKVDMSNGVGVHPVRLFTMNSTNTRPTKLVINH